MTPEDAEALQQRLAEWTRGEPSWRAIAVVGSWARGAARADSDLDLMVLVDDLGRWTTDAQWLGNVLKGLGRAAKVKGLEVHGVARSWRVTLGAGAELDLCLADTGWACTERLDPGTRRVVEDGIRPLVDKDGMLAALQERVASSSPVRYLRAMDREYVIDGARVASLDDFFEEFGRVVIPGVYWGQNLNAFNDVLRGGFGTPDEGFILRWANSERSKVLLGHAETAKVLERAVERCDSGNRAGLERELSEAGRGEGPTIFDWLVEIISKHGAGGTESQDNVSLILE